MVVGAPTLIDHFGSICKDCKSIHNDEHEDGGAKRKVEEEEEEEREDDDDVLAETGPLRQFLDEVRTCDDVSELIHHARREGRLRHLESSTN